MKKQVKILVFIAVLGLSNITFAYNNENFQCNEKKLCLSSDDLMKEVVKETINTVGKHILNKYLGDKEEQKNSSNSGNTGDSAQTSQAGTNSSSSSN